MYKRQKDNTTSYVFTTNEAVYITSSNTLTGDVTAEVNNNTITFATLSDGTYESVTIIVTDATGNSSSALAVTTFVIDTTAPTFSTSPASVTVECSASSEPSATGTALSGDSTATVSYSDSTVDGTGNNSVITRVWTATDPAGNSTTYTQTITVVDTTAPTFTTSPASVTVECNTSTSVSRLGTAAASDNCDLSLIHI